MSKRMHPFVRVPAVLGALVFLGAVGGAVVMRAEPRSEAVVAKTTEPSPTFEFLVQRRDASEVVLAVAALGRAAEGGDIAAQHTLGRVYLQGLPAVPADRARAQQWFTRAAEAGHPEAAYALGTMATEPTAAIPWFERAVLGGSVRGMFALANAYRSGTGVPRDDARALALYGQAAEHEDPAALQTLAMAYRQGELGLEPDEDEARRFAMEAEHASHHAH